MAANPLKVKTIALSSLTPDPDNDRTHSERNIEAIRKSLETFGQRSPIRTWLNPEGEIIVVGGNGTLEAMKRLGWTKAVIAPVPDDWTWEQAKAYAIADNRSGELAGWDSEHLLRSLQRLSDEMRAGTGFTPEEIGDLDRLHGPPPSLDDLEDEIGGMRDDDLFVRISFRVEPEIAGMWSRILEATGIEQPDAAAAAVIEAAHRGFSGDG